MKRRTNATFLKSSIGRYNPDRQPACLAVFLTSLRSVEVKVPDCGLPVKPQLVRSKWPWVNNGLNVLYQQLCDAVFSPSWHHPQSTHQVPGHISKGQTSICHRSSSWIYRMHILGVFPLSSSPLVRREQTHSLQDIWVVFQSPNHLVLLRGAGIVGEWGSCLWLFCFVKPNQRNVCASAVWKAADVISVTAGAIMASLDGGAVIH